jgi:hypothetical protein
LYAIGHQWFTEVLKGESEAAWQQKMTRQPALALTRIVAREQMCSARVPVIPSPLTHLHPYMRITLNVADVSRLHPMLCHKPELRSYAPIAHWRASWLPRFLSFRTLTLKQIAVGAVE